jgi:DnaK suppressor protein
MTKRDLLKYEKRLLAEKTRLLKQRGYTGALLLQPEKESGTENNVNPSDIAEQGYDTYQREMASRLTSDQTKVLMEIDEALRRIERKSYGLCETCGKPIPKARLDLVPYARYDIKCLKARESQVRPGTGRRRRR